MQEKAVRVKRSERAMRACKVMGDEVSFMTILNEKYPSLENGLPAAAMEQILGTVPAIVVFPKSWNTSVEAVERDDLKRFWRQGLTSASFFCSATFAASCSNLVDATISDTTTATAAAATVATAAGASATALDQLGAVGLMGAGSLDSAAVDAFLPLLLTPLCIQLAAALVEKLVGMNKGVKVSSILMPTFLLFDVGARSTYLSRPRNRNDLFDVALSGVGSALGISFVCLLAGAALTAAAPAAELAAFPSLPAGLLNSNSMVQQIAAFFFGPALLAQVDPDAAVDVSIHLHWLAIGGATSLIASVLQLLPVDNSAGSKLSFAVLGVDNFTFLELLTGIIKFLVLFPMLFTLGTAVPAVLTKERVFVDYLLSSQIAGSGAETQYAEDNLSDISEGRKILFYGLAALLGFSVLPFAEIQAGIQGSWAELSTYLQGVASGNIGDSSSLGGIF